MTNLTRLRLILVDLSGLMKKKTNLKQNILFIKGITLECNLQLHLQLKLLSVYTLQIIFHEKKTSTTTIQ